jgi:ATP dependent DNA ligase domain
MESKSPLGGNLPGGFIFQPALITKTEGKACLSLADLAENRYIFPQFSCQGSALALRGGSETRLLSRNQKDLGSKFPEVKDSIAALNIQDVIIDGEIVALDEKGRSSFQLLQSFDMGEDQPPIVFYAFDLLRLNGKDLTNLPIEDRKAKL